ncbi:MAG: cyclic nucleotide-binding domain-containing protein [Parvibaculum sp.]
MSLRTIITLLRRHDLFAQVDAARLEVIAFTAERETFEPGDILFEEGEEAFDAYLFLKGQAVMFSGDEATATKHKVDVGDLVGEKILLGEGHYRSTIRATAHVEVLCVSRYLFQRMLEEFPEMAGAVAAALARRLDVTMGEMTKLAADMKRPAAENNKPREQTET